MLGMHYKQNSACKNGLMNTHNSKLIIFYHFTVIKIHDFLFSYQINRLRTIKVVYHVNLYNFLAVI